MQAAFHLAYCVSCNRKEGRDGGDDCSDENRRFSRCPGRRPYVVASYVDLVHPVCYRQQKLDSEFLVRHIDIRHDLTAWS